MPEAYIGLGSNQQDPLWQIEQALQAFKCHPFLDLFAISSLYLTPPWGEPIAQPDFVNAVIGIRTSLTPHELLAVSLAIEQQQGRVRSQKNGPRTLDCDLLYYEHVVLQAPELTLPHPRLHLRAFVLFPLKEIAPQIQVLGQPLDFWLAHCDKTGIKKLIC